MTLRKVVKLNNVNNDFEKLLKICAKKIMIIFHNFNLAMTLAQWLNCHEGSEFESGIGEIFSTDVVPMSLKTYVIVNTTNI